MIHSYTYIIYLYVYISSSSTELQKVRQSSASTLASTSASTWPTFATAPKPRLRVHREAKLHKGHLLSPHRTLGGLTGCQAARSLGYRFHQNSPTDEKWMGNGWEIHGNQVYFTKPGRKPPPPPPHHSERPQRSCPDLSCGAKLDPLVIQDSYGYKLKPMKIHEIPVFIDDKHYHLAEKLLIFPVCKQLQTVN